MRLRNESAQDLATTTAILEGEPSHEADLHRSRVLGDARVGILEPDVHQLFAEAVHVGRELKEGADNEPVEWCAGHGFGARAGLVLRPDCVVVLEVDLASVAHAVAWD